MMAVFFLPPGSLPPLSMRANTSALPGFSSPPTATWSLALTSTPGFLAVSATTMTRSDRECLHGANGTLLRDDEARDWSVAPGQRPMVTFMVLWVGRADGSRKIHPRSATQHLERCKAVQTGPRPCAREPHSAQGFCLMSLPLMAGRKWSKEPGPEARASNNRGP